MDEGEVLERDASGKGKQVEKHGRADASKSDKGDKSEKAGGGR